MMFNQLKFDLRRHFLRNSTYTFFTILMPMGFYLLFTKVMSQGSAAELATFAKTYLGSMAVYSLTINALFGVASILHEDRESRFVTRLSLTPAGTMPYYLSISTLVVLMNALSVLLLELAAILVNGVRLAPLVMLGSIVIAVLASLPLIALGVLYSYAPSQQTLSVMANLTAFPMAIISGLWWPISMLPSWAQHIGKLMPAYFGNDLLTRFLQQQSLPARDMMGLAAWLLLLGGILVGSTLLRRRRMMGEKFNGRKVAA